MKHTNLLRIVVGCGCAAALAPSIATAATVNFTYDALGRLTKVEHVDGPNAGASASYTYDAADNRIELGRVNPNPAPDPDPQPTNVKVVVLPIMGFVVIPIAGQ